MPAVSLPTPLRVCNVPVLSCCPTSLDKERRFCASSGTAAPDRMPPRCVRNCRPPALPSLVALYSYSPLATLQFLSLAVLAHPPAPPPGPCLELLGSYPRWMASQNPRAQVPPHPPSTHAHFARPTHPVPFLLPSHLGLPGKWIDEHTFLLVLTVTHNTRWGAAMCGP